MLRAGDRPDPAGEDGVRSSEEVADRAAGQAWQLLKKDHFDLVVLDVGLPDENGFDLCRRIRTFSEVPVIFLTAPNA